MLEKEMEALKRLNAKVKAKKEYNKNKCRRYYYSLNEEQRENRLEKKRKDGKRRRDLTRKNVFKERRNRKGRQYPVDVLYTVLPESDFVDASLLACLQVSYYL